MAFWFLEAFVQTIGSQLAGQALSRSLLRAIVFWAALAGLYLASCGSQGWSLLQTLLSREELILARVIPGAILFLLAIWLSAWFARRSASHVLQFAAGSRGWPSRLRAWASQRWAGRRQNLRKQIDELNKKCNNNPKSLDAAEKRRWARIDIELEELPKTGLMMPTRLGNILLGLAEYPSLRYGLDFYACWPRLRLLLPEEAVRRVQGREERMLEAAEAAMWVVAFPIAVLAIAALTFNALIVGLLAPLTGIASLALWLLYQDMIEEARAYKQEIQSAFDLYRLSLYTALGWQAPGRDQEAEEGERLTQFLWRGE